VALPKFRIERIKRVPREFDLFRKEIADQLAALYGERAAQEYRNGDPQRWIDAFASPQVSVYAALRGGLVCALLIGTVRPHVLQISYIHVLRSHEGEGIEGMLVLRAVNDLRLAQVAHVLIEPIPFSRLDMAAAAESLGFKRVSRQIMTARTPLVPPTDETDVEIGLLDSPGISPAAECLCAAYHDHPGKMLHYEVNSSEETRAFIWRVMSGHFGRFAPGLALRCGPSKETNGILLAAESLPGLGFILQVAVTPASQGRGNGEALIREVAGCFQNQEIDQIGLGVTKNNPARRLYERIGFRAIQDVDAFVWWKQWP
jgi:ribosomal protein S18 acetylase RimI-like enzyme